MNTKSKRTPEAPRFFVAGAAHLDIISVASGDLATLDKKGSLHLEIGGTAFNVAHNLRELGGSVKLLTAMAHSPFTDIILEDLSDDGIQVYAKQHSSLPMGGFSAHLTPAGELLSAVSACPVELYRFDDLEIDEVLQSSSAAIADCNLNLESLGKISKRSVEVGVPLFVAGVSQEKSLRLEVCMGSGHTFFLSRDELLYFLKRTGRQGLLSSKGGLDLCRSTGSNWVVSDGKRGITYYSSAGILHLPSAADTSVKTWPGVRDMLLAATVWHKAAGFADKEALELGLLQAERIIGRQNCSLASPGRVENSIQKLTQATRTDLLTGLHNRRGLEREMGSQAMKALARKGLVSALILDIDKFKAINDEFGHGVGDLIIAWVAQQIKSAVREHDVAGRWGGEEYIVLLPGEGLAGAALVAERIRERVESMSTASAVVPKQITVSIGVACCTPGEPFDSAINRADGALYSAKAGGRNRVELAIGEPLDQPC